MAARQLEWGDFMAATPGIFASEGHKELSRRLTQALSVMVHDFYELPPYPDAVKTSDQILVNIAGTPEFKHEGRILLRQKGRLYVEP
jgi:hypothetical protein